MKISKKFNISVIFCYILFKIFKFRALLERQERLDAVIANIQRDQSIDEETKAQHVSDVETAYISVAEKEILAKYRRTVAKIQQSEIEIDQTLFLLQLYSKYLQPPVILGKKKAKTVQI